MPASTVPPGFHPVRRDRLLQEQKHDEYQIKGKLPEPSVCSRCGAVYHEGRWQWIPIPQQPHRVTCPACHRIQDNFPAGFVTLEGAFVKAHRKEITRLIRNQEQREREEHPLKRIIEIETPGNEVRVTTTDIHLARSIGEAVHQAYQGELEYHYNPDQMLLRVHWVRQD